MREVNLREYEDLPPKTQERIENELKDKFVKRELRQLSKQLERGEITEEQYYEQIGCSQYYAETTSWFVPAKYYDKHKDSIDAKVEARLQTVLFDENDNIVYA